MRVNKAVFLDRDGILVIPNFKNGRSFAPRLLSEFRFYDNIRPYLERFKNLGYLNIIITNQPDIQNGLLKKSVLEEMHKKIVHLFPIDDVEFCTHNKHTKCRRRKPNPGMLIDSAKKWNINFEKSFMIGDRKSDIDVGKKVGTKTIFVDYNYTEEKPLDADFSTDNVMNAFEYVLSTNNKNY